MATLIYPSYTGEKSNGGTNFGFAGAYISKAGNNNEPYGKDTQSWYDKRRFVGSDINEGYWYTYTYCAFADIPLGSDFSITLTLTVNNSTFYGGGNRQKTLRAGYSTYAPVEGTERAAGKTDDVQYVTASDITIAATSSSKTNTSGTITLNLPNSCAGKRVYFYFWAKNHAKNYSCFKFAGLAATLQYTDYTSPTKPSINSIQPAVMPKGGEVKLVITAGGDGTNNPISSYKIYYGTSSGSTSKSFVKSKPGSDGEITVSYADINSPSPGTKIYFSIQAIGTISGYDSEISSNSSIYVIVNSPPSRPSVTLSKSILPNSGIYEDIEITKLIASDPDGDPLTYQYVSSSSTTAPSSGWAEIEEGDTIQCSSLKPYIFFRANDGHQNGPTNYKAMVANVGPEGIAIGSVIGEGYYGYTGEYYTRKISVAAAGDSSYIYNWEYRYGASGSWMELGTGQTLNNMVLTSGSDMIYVRVTATDSLGDINQTEPYETGLYYARALTDKDISITTYPLFDKKTTSKTDAYSRKMSASFEYAPQTKKDPTISSVQVALKQGETEYDMIMLTGTFNKKDVGNQQDKNLEFSQSNTKLLSSAVLTYSFYCENAGGDQLLLYEKNYEIKLLPLLDFVFSPEMTDAQKQINLDIVNLTSGTEQFIVRYLREAEIEKYEIMALLDGVIGEKNLTEYAIFSVDNTDSALISFPSDKLEAMFQSMKLVSDKDYRGTVAVYAVNVLGESYKSSGIENGNKGFITIKTTAAPFFRAKDGNNAPFIKQYISQTPIITGDPTPNWSQPLPEDKTRMLNPEEYFYLDTNYEIYQPMSKWFDGSGEPPKARASSYKYTIVYTVDKDGTGPNENSSWQVVGDLSDVSALGVFQFPTSLQPLEGPERIFFGLKVKDELGLYAINDSNGNAEQLYVSDPNQFLLWCRRTTPIIRIADCEYNETSDGGYYMVTLDTEDFGGNNKGYQNFNRFGSSNSIEEKSEGAMKITWSCGTTLESMKEVTDTYRKGRISALEQNEDGTNPSFDFGTLGGLKGKIYLRATITFYTNVVGAELVARTQIFVLQTETPTVAYRNHLLGINTKPDDIAFESDVLVIGDFQNKRFIRLMAVDDNGEPREILINLKEGTVSGLIIDGGTW